MDPRVAGRRAEVGRAAGRKRLGVLLTLLSLSLLTAAVLFVAHSSLLSARHVRISGNVMTPAQEILAASGLETHPPLIDVSISRVVAGIDKLPWIERVRVARDWPDSVSITVTERNPVAVLVLSPRRAAVLDATGRVLEFAASVPKNLVPIAAPGDPVSAGAWLGPPGATLARVAAAVPASVLSSIAELKESALGVEVALRSGAVADLGRATGLAAKMVALATLLQTPTVVLGPRSSIDLRVPEAPVVTS